jgi:hypothetical protein
VAGASVSRTYVTLFNIGVHGWLSRVVCKGCGRDGVGGMCSLQNQTPNKQRVRNCRFLSTRIVPSASVSVCVWGRGGGEGEERLRAGVR